MKNTSSKLIMLTLVAALAACGGDNTAKPAAGSDAAPQQEQAVKSGLQTKFVTVGTGGASGPYNIIGTALSELYAQKFGVNAKTQTTGASVENLNLLAQNKLELAFVMSDALSDAVNGQGSFSSKVDNVEQIAALYPNYVQIVTSASSGIKSIEDLRGKRVAVGAQGSGTEMATRTLLAGFGITYQDIKVDYLGFAEASDALKSGKLEVAFFSSGLPNSALMELQQGFDLQLVAVPADKLADIAKTAPFFNAMPIPKGTYGNAEDVPAVAIANALAVRKDMSEEDVYQLTKALFENLDKLQTAHQAAKGISLEGAQRGLVAPLHAGAKRYYDEVGAMAAPAAPAASAASAAQ